MIEFPGCFSCLNGLALEAGFISGRFGWNLPERGVAATMAELAPFYNTAKSKNLRRANVLRRRPRETHLQQSSRRLPSVNFKKQKNYLLLFFFFNFCLHRRQLFEPSRVEDCFAAAVCNVYQYQNKHPLYSRCKSYLVRDVCHTRTLGPHHYQSERYRDIVYQVRTTSSSCS